MLPNDKSWTPGMPTNRQASNPVDIARIEALIDDRFPQIHAGGRIMFVEDVGIGTARVRMRHHERVIRPGGTVSGPAMPRWPTSASTSPSLPRSASPGSTPSRPT